MAWHGVARQARLGMAGEAWHGGAGPGMAGHGVAWQARRGWAWRGVERLGKVRRGWFDVVRLEGFVFLM